MRSWLLKARESFWFLPTIFGIGAVALALGLVELDHFLVDSGVSDIPLIEDLSPTGGRAILAAIGGTMLGVAATSFSITISVLATTSSAYGPRLVRNFMADRGNQLVLAVLTSTFLYALIVLRSVHTEADSTFTFVPVLAITFAVLLAVCDVAVLVYFIHHIATSVQVTTLQKRVLTELETVIDLLYPEQRDDSAAAGPATAPSGPPSRIESRETGYVAQIELDELIAAATKKDAVCRVLAIPGDYVLTGDLLAEVSGAPVDTDAFAAAFIIEAARTPHQDVRFAVQQVTEIGVRGLASGTNDPYTAVTALDALGGALATLCTRPPAITRYADEDGAHRLTVDWPDAESLIADAYLAIRTYGMQHPLVVQAALRFSQRLERVATGTGRLTLRREVEALRLAYQHSEPAAVDSLPLETGFAQLDERLGMIAG